MRAFHEAIYLDKKKIYKNIAVGVQTCCLRNEEIEAVLSGDIISILCVILPVKCWFLFRE